LAEVIHGNNLFKEPYMSLSSHVHHFAAFALYISIYDLVIFIDVIKAHDGRVFMRVRRADHPQLVLSHL
jgi:hypothetical protein